MNGPIENINEVEQVKLKFNLLANEVETVLEIETLEA
jgi:hypothetical protein